jgi:RNase adapter protein RapZ
MPSALRNLLIVSGISGSGKTIALNALEDQGFYCVDNLPAGLVRAFSTQTLGVADGQRVAVGIDARNRESDLQQIPAVISDLAAAGIDVQLVFLESSDDILLKRYSETRRRHPLSLAVNESAPVAAAPAMARAGLGLKEAIARERRLMQPIASLADVVIDTTELNVHQLRRRIITELGVGAAGLSVLFESFAYKKGVPLDADFVFDARGLPNPHWDARLRPLSGRDAPVREWLSAHGDVQAFLSDVSGFLSRWLPPPDSTERSYVTVAIGCTGGRHRSVYLIEALAQHFTSVRDTRGMEYGAVMRFHRELG